MTLQSLMQLSFTFSHFVSQLSSGLDPQTFMQGLYSKFTQESSSQFLIPYFSKPKVHGSEFRSIFTPGGVKITNSDKFLITPSQPSLFSKVTPSLGWVIAPCPTSIIGEVVSIPIITGPSV